MMAHLSINDNGSKHVNAQLQSDMAFVAGTGGFTVHFSGVTMPSFLLYSS